VVLSDLLDLQVRRGQPELPYSEGLENLELGEQQVQEGRQASLGKLASPETMVLQVKHQESSMGG